MIKLALRGMAERRLRSALTGVAVLLGVAMIVRTVTLGGGPVAIGVILGTLFILAGAGRLWVARG